MITHMYGFVLKGPTSLATWLAADGRTSALMEKLVSFHNAAEAFTDETWDDPGNPWKHLPYDDDLENHLLFALRQPASELVRILCQMWEEEKGRLTLVRHLDADTKIVVVAGLLYQHGDCVEEPEYRSIQLLEFLGILPLLGVTPLSGRGNHG